LIHKGGERAGDERHAPGVKKKKSKKRMILLKRAESVDFVERKEGKNAMESSAKEKKIEYPPDRESDG